MMFACFIPSLCSCHEKATVALYFGRILIRSGAADFQISFPVAFFDLFPVILLFVGSHQAEIIVVKRLIK